MKTEKPDGAIPRPLDAVVLWVFHFLRFLWMVMKDTGLFILQSIAALVATPFLIIGLPFWVAWETWLKGLWNKARR